jgi:hypothetical protein
VIRKLDQGNHHLFERRSSCDSIANQNREMIVKRFLARQVAIMGRSWRGLDLFPSRKIPIALEKVNVCDVESLKLQKDAVRPSQYPKLVVLASSG